jgi:hypothetical protein
MSRPHGVECIEVEAWRRRDLTEERAELPGVGYAYSVPLSRSSWSSARGGRFWGNETVVHWSVRLIRGFSKRSSLLGEAVPEDVVVSTTIIEDDAQPICTDERVFAMWRLEYQRWGKATGKRTRDDKSLRKRSRRTNRRLDRCTILSGRIVKSRKRRSRRLSAPIFFSFSGWAV